MTEEEYQIRFLTHFCHNGHSAHDGDLKIS